MDTVCNIAKRVWAFPNTSVGLTIGILGVLFGGKMQIKRECVEFHGGLVQWLLQKMPTGSGALAMTLGHRILGQTEDALEITRDHEHVHVRQYERWGPLFVPAYLFASIWAWLHGGHHYRDNVFEKEAFGEADYGSKT